MIGHMDMLFGDSKGRDMLFWRGDVLYVNTTPDALKAYVDSLCTKRPCGYAFHSPTGRERHEIDGIQRLEVMERSQGRPLTIRELTGMLHEDPE